MKKIKSLFGLFFVMFLFICAVPTVTGTVSWLKEFYFRQYDRTMRKYNTAYIEIPKKQGKSELGAAVALNMLCNDDEPP